jgi:predicted double-glycine peptidase
MATAFQSNAFQSNAFQIADDEFSGSSGARGNYLEWWEREWNRIREERKQRLKKKVPRKQRVELEKLDEILLEIRGREDAKRMDKLRSLEAFMQTAATLEDLRRHVKMAEALLREMDDEEAIIALAIH